MTTADTRPRQSLTPALAAAVVLHLLVFGALALLAERSTPLPAGTAVPINIVSGAPKAASRPAEVNADVQPAATETPTHDTAPPVPPPPAASSPARPEAVEKPAPRPTEASHAPGPGAQAPVSKAAAQPKTEPQRPPLDLDALAASISRTNRPAAKPALARHGPTRAETAPVSRPNADEGVTQSDAQGLQQLLNRLWNPNCSVEGGDAVTVPVRFAIGKDGQVIGRVTGGGEENSSDPIVYAAARRAIDAVHQAEPYGQAYRGQRIEVIFNAQKACSQR
jgi:periplasmic protein TonB